MAEINLALVQMRCEKGAIDENLAQMQVYVHEAAQHGADFVIFPEMCITGYIDPTRRPEAMLLLDGPEVARVAALT